MKPYEIIEHTADIGLKAFGKTLEELFHNAAIGMFDIIGGEEKDPPRDLDFKKDIKIEKDIDTYEELLVVFLSELLYIANKQKVIFRSFDILELDDNGIISNAKGKKLASLEDAFKVEIKAVTFHDLKIEKEKDIYYSTIIFDV
ncbi:MAG: archease [Candidatus Omnitrophota bacterium]